MGKSRMLKIAENSIIDVWKKKNEAQFKDFPYSVVIYSKFSQLHLMEKSKYSWIFSKGKHVQHSKSISRGQENKVLSKLQNRNEGKWKSKLELTP